MICSVYFNISNAAQHYKTRNRPLFYVLYADLKNNRDRTYKNWKNQKKYYFKYD